MTDSSQPTADDTAAIPGPWRHEQISAAGSRFHVALAGPTESESLPVVLLPSFPQTWWAWRGPMITLAQAGVPVAAMDLRGVGGSDRPPAGYDIPTLTRDVAGVIRALGWSRAAIVGHGVGGLVAWSMPALQPDVTAAIAAVSAPHPAGIHVPPHDFPTGPAHRWRHLVRVPGIVEHALHRDLVPRTLRSGSPRTNWDPEVVATYRRAVAAPFAARTATASLRWLARSRTPEAHRFRVSVRRAITVPALLVHGTADPFVPATSVALDAAALCTNLRVEALSGAGHYLPEERADEVASALNRWLASLL